MNAEAIKADDSVLEAHRKIKESMRQVFSTYQQYCAAGVDRLEAVAALKAAAQHLQDLSLPRKADQQQAAAYIDRLEELTRASSEASLLRGIATAHTYKIKAQLVREYHALTSALKPQSADVGLPENDSVVYAGRSFAKMIRKNAELESGFPEIIESSIETPMPPSVEALAAIEQMRQVSVDIVVIAGQLNELLPSAIIIQGALDCGFPRPEVRNDEPVRPIEEEVERFLSQAEKDMLDRQSTHRAAGAVIKQLVSLLRQFDERYAALTSWRALMPELIENCDQELQVSVQAAATLSNSVERLRRRCSLKMLIDNRKLDVVERSIPGRREAKDIERLRKLLRETAFAIGRCNEATTAAYASHTADKSSYSWSKLIGVQRTWAECREWLDENKQLEEEARRKNQSLTQKAALLGAICEQCRRERESHYKELCQVVAEIIHKRKSVPCDELRVLMNTAAWVSRDRIARDEVKYPIY